MPTTLYLRAGSISDLPIRFSGGPTNSSTSFVEHELTPSPVLKLGTAAGSVTSQFPIATVTGPVTAPGRVSSSGSSYPVWVTAPLSSGVTISGTIAVDLWAFESAMTVNATVGYVLWRVQPNGTASVISQISAGTELGTSNAQVSLTDAAPTSTACNPGDVLALAVYADDASGVTMASGSVNITYHGPEGGTGDSQIRFTETLSFADAPAGTTTNLLADASDLGGSGKKKLWTDSASGSTTYTVNTVAAPSIAQWTDSPGGTVLEWLTPPLAPVTVEGYFTAVFRGSSNNIVSRVNPLFRIYKTATDGSSPTLVGQARGGLDAYGTASSLTTTDTDYTIYGHIAATISSGERLMVRLYTSSSSVNQASGYTASVVVEGTTNTSITWPVTLSESSGDQNKTPSDTLTATISESISISAAISPTDTLTGSISDTAAIAASVPGTDTLTANIADSASVEVSVPKPVSDTLTGSISDSISVAATVGRSDTLTASIAESIAIAATVAVTDAITATIADSAEKSVLVSVSDTLTATISQSESIVKTVDKSTSDTLTATVSQSISIAVSVPVTDTLTSSISGSISPAAAVSVNDTLTSTVSNSATIQGAIALSDALTASISEAITAAVQLSTSDTITVTVTQNLSGFPTAYGFKYYNGTWQTGTAKYWNGTTWVPIASVKRYNGSQWV